LKKGKTDPEPMRENVGKITGCEMPVFLFNTLLEIYLIVPMKSDRTGIA
jgi:hypothetical protein